MRVHTNTSAKIMTDNYEYSYCTKRSEAAALLYCPKYSPQRQWWCECAND